jgi:hypothetical protein
MAGLVLALAGCGGGAGEPHDEGLGDGAAGGPTTSGGAHDVDVGGLPHDGAPMPNTTFDDGDGNSSGSVEETLFGMSDDLPLVADIPDIKRGALSVRTWVVIEQVRPTTGRAELGRDAWFYVQDPTAEEHMGLRVLLPPGDVMPSEDRAVDLQGWVLMDAQGWLLELESAVEGSMQPALLPQRLRMATLRSEAGLVYDDALVEVAEPSALVVTRGGPVPGTVLVGAVANSSGAVLVDMRPFGLDLDLPPGTQLSRLRGVAELGGSRPVILPRIADDLVVAR